MPSPSSQKRFFLLLLLTSLIATPILYAAALMQQLNVYSTLSISMGAGGITLLLYGLRALPRHIGNIITLTVLSAALLTRLAYLGLIQFSGAGFNAEFFLHLGGESAVAAWRLFGLWLAAGMIAAL
ncbi:hypothetical protein, partial [Gilvimarinus polysaccharolyticus]|uniref:hypothetical protein n=1 Tax=Gilvimarinus polysaccharolyticus TaxID=863921 RepID=UPI0018DE59AA